MVKNIIGFLLLSSSCFVSGVDLPRTKEAVHEKTGPWSKKMQLNLEYFDLQAAAASDKTRVQCDQWSL